MFLSQKAVYILVTDISKHISAVVEGDDCYFDSHGAKQCLVSEFLDFWLNSVHSCSPKEGTSKRVPSVILVGSHADKLAKEGEIDRQRKADSYFEAVRHHLSDKPTRFLVADEAFALDNTKEDPNLDALKNKIVQVAKSQPFWGERIPAKWLPLEKAIIDLREAGHKVVDFSIIEEANSKLTVPITSTEELELFLKFQHESGNVLYFCEDTHLRDKVVIDCQWLVDALKSLITKEKFVINNPELIKYWEKLFMRGILCTELLDGIWNEERNPSFHNNRIHLLALLEKLNIISRQKPWMVSDVVADDSHYLVPCMVRNQPPVSCLMPSTLQNSESTSVLVFVFVGKFIPTAVFHRLLSACIGQWPIWQQDQKDLIFCGCGVFKIDSTHQMTIIFREYTIQTWVTKFGTEEKGPHVTVCIKIREFLENCLKCIIGYLVESSHYQMCIRCPKSTYRELDAMVTVSDLQKEKEIACSNHIDTHVIKSDEMLKYWYIARDGKETTIENLASGGATPHSCLSSSVRLKCPTEKELNKIAIRIGKEFEQLALELGLRQSTLDDIKYENPFNAVNQKFQILYRWRQANGLAATFQALEKAMRAVNIDTIAVFRDFDECI